MKEHEIAVVDNISRLIMQDLKNLSTEQRHPGGCADSSDAEMSDLKVRIARLQKIRADFELTLSEAVGFKLFVDN